MKSLKDYGIARKNSIMEEGKNEITFMRLLYLLVSLQEKVIKLFNKALAFTIFHSGDKKSNVRQYSKC